MSEPRLHFRLIDENGTVHVDQDMWYDPEGFDDGVMAATAHADIADALDEQGIRWRLEVTDPDGDLPGVQFGTWQEPSEEGLLQDPLKVFLRRRASQSRCSGR